MYVTVTFFEYLVFPQDFITKLKLYSWLNKKVAVSKYQIYIFRSKLIYAPVDLAIGRPCSCAHKYNQILCKSRNNIASVSSVTSSEVM